MNAFCILSATVEGYRQYFTKERFFLNATRKENPRECLASYLEELLPFLKSLGIHLFRQQRGGGGAGVVEAVENHNCGTVVHKTSPNKNQILHGKSFPFLQEHKQEVSGPGWTDAEERAKKEMTETSLG